MTVTAVYLNGNWIISLRLNLINELETGQDLHVHGRVTSFKNEPVFDNIVKFNLCCEACNRTFPSEIIRHY